MELIKSEVLDGIMEHCGNTPENKANNCNFNAVIELRDNYLYCIYSTNFMEGTWDSAPNTEVGFLNPKDIFPILDYIKEQGFNSDNEDVEDYEFIVDNYIKPCPNREKERESNTANILKTIEEMKKSGLGMIDYVNCIECPYEVWGYDDEGTIEQDVFIEGILDWGLEDNFEECVEELIETVDEEDDEEDDD